MFKSVPVGKVQPIPFKPEVAELSAWLRKKMSGEKWASCAEVFNVVQGINALNLNPKQKFIFLEGINTFVKNFTKQVENSYLESSFPMSTENLAHVELITWIYAELAKGYFSIVEDLDDEASAVLSGERKALILYRALQASGMAFLHISEAYLEPYQGFWQHCYRIYTKARDIGVLDLEIQSSDIKSETVNGMFKQILVLELCDTNQFRPKEMQTIYQFLGGFVDYAAISTEQPDDSSKLTTNLVRLDSDDGPVSYVNAVIADNMPVLYVNVVKIAKRIYQCLQEKSIGKGALKSINEALFLRVVKTLGKVQKRRHTRIKEERDCSVIIGITSLISYLHSLDKSLQDDATADMVDKYQDARMAGMWKVPDIELVPMGEEVGLQMEKRIKDEVKNNVRLSKIINAANQGNVQSGIWDQSVIEQKKIKDEIDSDTFEILNSSTRGYNAKCKAGSIKVRIGEVFAVVAGAEERIEVGLIRRISYSDNDELLLGVELIGWETRAVSLSRASDASLVWAIMLPGEGVLKEKDSLLFESGNFLPGEFVDLRQGKTKIKCRLNKALHSTSSVTHVELFYPNMENEAVS